MTSIRKLLVANRGEIASRIFRTCDAMGIATVAVYSDADRDLPFVRHAGEAFRLGPAPSRESYLVVDRILAAARATGADAVHPGFGFLAENDAFAEAVIAAGLTWVGPSPAAIRAMGLKREAKLTAAEAGVPVIPGYSGADQSLEAFQRAAADIGLPLLLKASAGGGGKGMRIVRDLAELPAAYESARGEAENAFGNPTLIAEKYIERPRHIEIQILGDTHGSVVHFGERECSIQRRHQKVVEEAPSPVLSAELRAQMGSAAVSLAKAIGYTNAGTVEFVVTGRSFYFLEVNTRLQVEHPVTEGVFPGLDLVEEQLRIARGEPLRWTSERIEASRTGASIEVRLCAEDPAAEFLPQSGPVVDFHLPASLLAEPWVRIESAVESGSAVSIHYDSMIAKLIVRADTRLDAIQRLERVLASLSVHGLRTNRAFLLEVIRHPAFVRGELDTHFIATHLEDARKALPSDASVLRAALVGTLFVDALRDRARELLPALEPAYRNNRGVGERSKLAFEGRTFEVARKPASRGRTEGDVRELLAAGVTAAHHAFDARVVDVTAEPRATSDEVSGVATVELGDHRVKARVVATSERLFVLLGGESFAFDRVPRFARNTGDSAADGCAAPMPGKVLRVLVKEGDTVEAGQPLLVLEAMKMEHAIKAPHAGTIAQLRVAAGEQVEGGQLLVALS